MKALRRKMTNESGMSVLLALAVVLVCAMVSAVVLMAAAANAGKAEAAIERNKSYYAVSSAARLLADDLMREQPTASVAISERTYACQESHPSYAHYEPEVGPELIFTSTTSASTPLILVMEEAVRTIDPEDPSSTFERDLFISAEGFDDVRAFFVMDSSYNVSIALQSLPTTEGVFGHELTVSFSAIASDPVETTRSDKEDVHWDGWEYTEEALSLPGRQTTTLNQTTGAYEPASNEYGHSVEQYYDIITTTTTTELSWSEPVISKGAQL